MLCILLISVVAKISVAYYTHSWLSVTRGLEGNLEGLIIGILVAYLSLFLPASNSKRVLLWTSTLGTTLFSVLQLSRFFYQGDCLLFFNEPYYAAFCDISISMMVSYLIFQCLGWRARNTKAVNSFAYLGRISYGIYLYHFLMLPFMPSWFSGVGIPMTSVDQSLKSFAVCSLLSIGVASLSWHFFEYPILRLRENRFFSGLLNTRRLTV